MVLTPLLVSSDIPAAVAACKLDAADAPVVIAILPAAQQAEQL